MISNNSAELNVRPVTIGRKDYLFSTSELAQHLMRFLMPLFTRLRE
ncbi:hypothetical protein [Weissella confusa]